MKTLILNEKKITFVFLCLACITISFNVAAIAAVLPGISSEFALSDIRVSRIISFYMIPYGFCALLYAPLTRHISYRHLLGVTMIMYGLMSFYCGRINTIQELLLGRVIMGLSGASAIPLGLIIIGKLFPYQQRGRLVGFMFSCSFIASMAGLLTSGAAHWRWLFLIPALMGILAGLGVLVIPVGILRQKHKGKISYWDTLRQRDIRHIFIFILVLSALYHGVHNWMGIYLEKIYALSQMQISTIFIVMAIGGAIGQMLGGFIADKKSRYAACFIGIIMLSGATLLLVGNYPIGFLILILSLLTAGWTVGHNGISTLLTDFPEDYRPQIASLNSSARFVAGGVGFYFSGFLVARGFNFAFFFIGVLMVMSALFLKSIIGFGKKHI